MFGGQQTARAIHFFGGAAVGAVRGRTPRDGFVDRLHGWNPIDDDGARGSGREAVVSRRTISRRKLLASGLTAAVGAAGAVGAVRLADWSGLIPPDHGGLYGIGETLTYASQRLLVGGHTLAREFSRADISSIIPVNGKPPDDEEFQRLRADGFRDWRLTVDGLVARPMELSLAELRSIRPIRRLPIKRARRAGRSSRSGPACGCRTCSISPASMRARDVASSFRSTTSGESIDMADALHPQNVSCVRDERRRPAVPHGAPVRVRVARQLGYKSIKYLSRMTVTDYLARHRQGPWRHQRRGGLFLVGWNLIGVRFSACRQGRSSVGRLDPSRSFGSCRSAVEGCSAGSRASLSNSFSPGYQCRSDSSRRPGRGFLRHPQLVDVPALDDVHDFEPDVAQGLPILAFHRTGSASELRPDLGGGQLGRLQAPRCCFRRRPARTASGSSAWVGSFRHRHRAEPDPFPVLVSPRHLLDLSLFRDGRAHRFEDEVRRRDRSCRASIP